MPLWGTTDTNASKPSYLKTDDRNNNNANTYGVSSAEQVSANAVFHGAHQGWVKVIPKYVDSAGQTRYKSETLVVVGSTITGNANVLCSGRVNVTANSVNITGWTGTRFTTELKVGDIITVGNNIFQNAVRQIISISNSSFLTVNSNIANTNTGVSLYVGDKAWFSL